MARRTVAKLIGAIRLVPVDSIGVPIFGAVRGNEMFVPEMDGDFRISDFTEFFNEEGYNVTYEVPDEFLNARFNVGSPTPIPFWIENACRVILGDADKEEPLKMFGPNALSHPVLADISRLLDDARSGRIQDRMKEWASQNIANSYADVFFETPIRSRYWVTRYRVAIAKARQLAKPPHPIDAKLRVVAGEWFRRFATKTDIGKLCGMLGTSANEVLTKRQITDIIFAFLIHKLAYNEFEDIETFVKEKSLRSAFPGGLYGHYIEHGWPRVPFDYKQQDNLPSLMMTELSIAHERENYLKPAKLSLLLFGRSRAPSQVESLAGTYLKETTKEFKQLMNAAKEVFRLRTYQDEWTAYADALLDYYDQMMDLDGIINPEDRNKRVPYDKRFGVRTEFLRDLKKISRGQW